MFFKGDYMKLEDIGFYTLSNDRCMKADHTTDLMRCELVLTDSCNFKCPYCRGQRKDLKKNLNLEEAKAIVDIWVKERVKNIRFSGGEPTVWKWIVELTQYAKDCGVERIAISSNGSASIEMYEKLINVGCNDFSISLDACCSAFGDKMAGVDGAFNKVITSIKYLSERVYTTVGIVVTKDTVSELKETVEFASSLGVSDIRIISAAQYNKLLEVSKTISQEVYTKYPILKYRIENTSNGVNVRGISENDSKKCWIALDDIAVAGDYHYPCIIYLREQGNPIGKIDSNVRENRRKWVENHNTHEDPICQKNCLDCIVKYNNEYERYRK